ncbi:MAG: ABC transporter permease [Lachnospiraceae bacterium]|nr:ABC transporter permease [Lachnospiraceae bacterium]
MKVKRAIFCTKVFIADKRTSVVVFAIGFLTMLLAISFITGLTYYNDAEIKELKEQFGSYVFRIENVSEKTIENIKEEPFVKKVIPIERVEYYSYNYNYEFMKTNEEFIENSPFVIEKGVFPKNKNQILANEYFLRTQGIKKEEMIGSIINIRDLGQFEVTGIITQNTLSTSSSSEWFYFISKADNECSGCAIIVDSLKKINEYHNILKNKYEISDENLFLNSSLVFSIMENQNESIFDKNSRVEKIVLIILIIISSILVVIVSRVIIFRNKKSIYVLLLNGLSSPFIKKILVFSGTIVYGIGNIIGTIFSLFTINSILYFKVGYCIFPLSQILLLNLIGISFLSLFLLLSLYKTYDKIVLNITNNNSSTKESILKKRRDYIRYFSGNKYSNKIEQIVSIAGISIATIIMIIMIYSTSVEYLNQDEMYELIVQLNKDDSYAEKIISEIECLKEIKEYYNGYTKVFQDDNKRGYDNNRNRFVFVTYPDDEFNKIYNGSTLDEKSVIVYSHVEFENGIKIKLNINKGDVVDVHFWANETTKQFKIAMVTDVLPLKPIYWESAVIFIVSENQFKKIFNNITLDFQNKFFYLKKGTEIITEDELNCLYQTPTISVNQPYKEFIEAHDSIEFAKKFFYTGCALVFALAILIIWGSIYVSIHIKEKEYILLILMGEKNSGVLTILCKEILRMWFIGEIIALFITYIATRMIYSKKYGDEMLTYFSYPWKNYIVGCAMSLFFIFITIIASYLEIKKWKLTGIETQ